MRGSRALRLLAALLIGLLALTAAQPRSALAAPAGAGYYNNASTISTSHPDWMKWLPDSESLGLISIPGTHDSMSIHGGDAAQAQSLCGANADSSIGNLSPCDLTPQLDAGIRYVDIRAACRNVVYGDGQDLLIYHGIQDEYASLGDATVALAAWLRLHPTETVIMRLSDNGNDNCTTNPYPAQYSSPFEYELATHYVDAYQGPRGNLFWEPPCVPLPAGGCDKNDSDIPLPTLGAVRGHVVLVKTFATTGGPYGFTFYDAHTDIQDYYDVCEVVVAGCPTDSNGTIIDFNDKARLVEAEATKANSGDGTILYLNHLSGSTHATPIRVACGTPCGTGEDGVPDQVLHWLLAGHVARTGVLIMDFPGPALIDAIIALNLPDATSVPGPEADYQQIVQNLSYAAEYYGDTGDLGQAHGRAALLDSFFSHVAAPGQYAHVVVANTGASYTAPDTDGDGLSGVAHGVDGYFNLVFTTLSNRSALSSAAVQAVADPVIQGFSTQANPDVHDRAFALYNALVAAYPGQLWTVTVHQDPGGGDNWWTYQQGVLYGPRPGDGYGYDISGVQAGVATVVSSSSSASSASSAATYGQAVTFGAQLTSAAAVPAGSVSFYDGDPAAGGVLIGSPQTPDASGQASVTTRSLGAGAHTIYAVYTSADGATTSQGTLSQQITPASLTITAGSPSMTYGDAVPAITPAYNGFVNGEGASALTSQPACSTAATSASGVGTYPTTCSGAADPNYAITYVPGTLTVTPATLTVTADDKGMTYGGTVPALTASYGGFVNGDTSSAVSGAPTCTTTATSGGPGGGGSAAGRYPITCAAGSLAAANYTVAFRPATLTVTPAPLTIAASDASMTYGGAVPAITPGYRGFVNGDTASALTTAPTCRAAATSASPVAGGPYATSCSGAADPNYTITYAPGALTVKPAPLTITADTKTTAYGHVPAYTWTGGGFVNGESAATLATAPNSAPSCGATVGGASVAATTPPGVYPGAIACSGAADPNYSITYATGTLTVDPLLSLDEQGLPSTVPHRATLDGQTVTVPVSVTNQEVAYGSSHSDSFPATVIDTGSGTVYFTADQGFSGTVTANITDTAVYQTMARIVSADLSSGGIANGGIANALTQQFAAVQADIAAGNTGQARADVQSFAAHVRAQSGQHLTAATAQTLLADAQLVYASLGGAGTV